MNKLAAMLIMVVLGFILVRTGVLKVEDSRAFSALTVYVLQPALILKAFQLELTQERLNGFLFGLAFSMGVFALWVVAVTLIKKPLHLDAIDQTTLVYPNTGNLFLNTNVLFLLIVNLFTFFPESGIGDTDAGSVIDRCFSGSDHGSNSEGHRNAVVFLCADSCCV